MRRCALALGVILFVGACAALVDDYAVAPAATCGDHGPPDPICAPCEEQACADELDACRADESCAPMHQCLVSCAASDGACRARCFESCPEVSESLSALTHCRRDSCRNECAACGGPYDTLAEPECDACLQKSCCEENTACFDDPGCAETFTCFEACGKTGGPPCSFRCQGIDPSADKLHGAVWACVQTCDAACRIGAHWECLGAHDLLVPEKKVITDRTQFLDFATLLPVPGLTVKACRVIDVNCNSPVDVQVSDVDGMVAHVLPTVVNNSLEGFAGYYEITGPGYYPQLRQFGRPLAFDRDARQDNVLALASIPGLEALSGLTIEPGRAHISLSVEDCTRHYARGVVVSVEPDVGTVIYFKDGFPSRQASATADGATVVIANLPPTSVVVRGHLEETGELVSEHSVFLRPDTVTNIILRPLRR